MKKILFVVLTCSVFYNHATYGSSHVSDSPTYPEATSESNRAISPLSTSISDSEIEKELDEFSPEPVTVFFERMPQFEYDCKYSFLETVRTSPLSFPSSAILAEALSNTMEENIGFTNSEVDIFDFLIHETFGLYDYVYKKLKHIYDECETVTDEQLPEIIEQSSTYFEKLTFSDDPLPHLAAQRMEWTNQKYNIIRTLLEYIRDNSKIEDSQKKANDLLHKLEHGQSFYKNDYKVLSTLAQETASFYRIISKYFQKYYTDLFLDNDKIRRVLAEYYKSISSSTPKEPLPEATTKEQKSVEPKVKTAL